jgi:hypothetical protein
VKLARQRVGAFDQGFGDAVVLDVEEADRLAGVADLGCSSFLSITGIAENASSLAPISPVASSPVAASGCSSRIAAIVPVLIGLSLKRASPPWPVRQRSYFGDCRRPA